MRLYEIPTELRKICEQIEDQDGEITPEQEDAISQLDYDFNRKAEFLGLMIWEAESDAKVAEREEQRFKKRRLSAERREKWLKSYVKVCLESAGVERVLGEKCKLRVQANSRPSINWKLEDDKLPNEFKKVTVELDGAAAYEKWKETGELPEGFEVNQGTHLRIW